jgi:hypothetical protein
MSHDLCVLDALLLLQWVRFNGGTGSLQTISEIDLHHGGTQILLTYLLPCLLACLLASVVDDASFEEKPEFIHFLKGNFFKLFLGFVFFVFFPSWVFW